MMLEELKLTSRKGILGAGIYEAGDPELCYTKLFVTDSGRVMPVNKRVLTEDDLLEVYRWGWQDALRRSCPECHQTFEGDESLVNYACRVWPGGDE